MNNDDGTERVVFGATGAKYVLRVVAAVICAVLLVGLTSLIVWMVMDACRSVYPPAVLWAVMGALSIGLIFGGWRIVLSYLRGRVELTPSFLHIGPRWLGESLACGDVEAIRLEADDGYIGTDGGPARLVIQIGNMRKSLFLCGQEKVCAEVLHRLCPNAAYVEADGTEHLPVAASGPSRTSENLVRERVRHGWRLIGAGTGMFLGSLAFCLVCVKLRIDGEDPPDVLGVFFPFVFVGLAMAIKGWMHVRRARR